MKFRNTLIAATFAAGSALGAANAAPCTIGTCDVTGGPLSETSPVAIQDVNVTPGVYEAEGSFDVGPGVSGANVFADIAFDEVLPGQTEVAAGFSDLMIEFSQEGTSLGSFLVTNADGTTEGGSSIQSFVISLISSAAVDFEIDGLAFLNSGASLPDFNFNLDAKMSPVPVPAALPLLLSGLLGLGFATRRKRDPLASQ